MADTTAVYARIDTKLKDNAEAILAQLGITPSCAITILYSQIVLQNGMPFDLRLPSARPTAIGNMSQAELTKGIASLQSDRSYSADAVDAELANEV